MKEKEGKIEIPFITLLYLESIQKSIQKSTQYQARWASGPAGGLRFAAKDEPDEELAGHFAVKGISAMPFMLDTLHQKRTIEFNRASRE